MKSIDNARICLIYLNILLCFCAIVSAQNKQENPINSNGSGRWTKASNYTDDQTGRKIDDEDACVMPPESLDKAVTYKCPYKQCDTESGYVPKSTVVSITCKPNYHQDRNTSSTSICYNKIWIPPIADCFKKCPKLNPINVNLRCIRNGIEIPCNENSLIVGTKIRPTCKPFHTYKDAVPDYVEITCEEDGKWDRTLFSCVPECGLVYTNNTHVFEYPWHVAIYNSRKTLICSGTIISPYLILTAAHCFQENDILANNTSKYEVVTSKVTRNYNTKDNENQKSFKIKEIRFSSKGYFGSADQYSSNIALVILEEKLDMSATVLPACVDWISAKRKIYPSESTPAQIPEWKTNARGVVDEKLTTTEANFVSRKRCLTMVPSDFKPLITFDKFCATHKNGTDFRLAPENGGSGLLFSENSFCTIRGIVSLQQHSSSVAVFTDLADHIDWISGVHNETENRTSAQKKVPAESSGENICNLYGFSNCTRIQDCSLTDVLIVTKKAILCGYDVGDTERVCCSTQYSSQVPPLVVDTPQVFSPTTTTVTPNLMVISKNSSITAAMHCAKYSKVVTSCSKDLDPRIGEVKPAGDREFPHVAVLGCGSELKDVYGCLMGSLISDTFILSVPPKDPKTIIKWVLLGDMMKYTTSWRYFRDKPYIIEKSFIHPKYTFPQNSIALYKLQTPVAMTSAIRPACLYLPNIYHPSIDVTNRKFRITSWGNISGGSSNLFKTGAIVVDDQHCLNAYEKGVFDPNSMMCVSNLTISEAFSLVNRGNPLKLASGSKSCTWSIFGLSLELPKSGEDLTKSSLFAFTKVSYYVDWIEGIVWPSTTSPQNSQMMSSVPVEASQFEGTAPNQLTRGRTSSEIALEYCDKYSRYGTVCVDDVPPRGTRKKALPKEYPHIAYIACESNVAGSYWTCVGSLISDRFVLSVAYCNTDGKGEAKLVRLGALSRSIIKNGSYDKVYEIERTYIHQDYSFPRRSIALYKLKTPVEFNAYIWPACLFGATYDQTRSRLMMTSWGSNTIHGESEDLQKGLLTVVDNQKCSSVEGYDSDSMVCVGDTIDGEALCVISPGSPLQMLQNNATCTRSIYAMHFGHTALPSSCRNVTNAKPHLFTKVSYYIDWIQKIVWP